MRLLLVISLALNILAGAIIIRLENFQYASLVGMCAETNATHIMTIERHDCLMNTKARTNGAWNLYYAVADQFQRFI